MGDASAAAHRVGIVRLTVLVSGNGSNLQAIIDAARDPNGLLRHASVVRVVSNKKSAFALQRARDAGIDTCYHNLISGGYTKRYPPSDPSSKTVTQEARAAYDADLATLLLADQPHLVVCAGWMHVLSPDFLKPLETAGLPVINLHPALPGEYNGVNAIERAYADFQQGRTKRSGCMIHYVVQEVDMGEPICTQELAFREGEPLDHFETRMHDAEHGLIIEGTIKAIDRLDRGG